MPFSNWFARLLFAFGRAPTPDRTPSTSHRPDSPIISHTGDPNLVVPIYQTQALTDVNGRAPEHTFAIYLHRALERAHTLDAASDLDLSHEVRFDYDPLDIEVPPLRNFRDADLPDRTQYNIILTDQGKNGVQGVTIANFFDDRGYSWKNMARVDRHLDHVWTGEEKIDANVHGALHEFLHLLGVHHDENPDEPGYQYPGESEMLSLFKWARSPMAASQPVNACGERVDEDPETKGRVIVRRQYYAPCEIEHVEIEGAP